MGVTTKALNQGVRRNPGRFPEDFMFRLSLEEAEAMRSQFVTASKRNVRFRPYAFTEQGVAMLSTVLKSDRAVQVSIAIIRVFVTLRQMALNHEQLRQRIDQLETKYEGHFRAIFEAVRELIGSRPIPPRRRIGFRTSPDSDPNLA